MTKEEWEKDLDEDDHRLLVKNTLPDHDQLMTYLRCLYPMTGFGDKLFCNGFMMESVELLKHGVFLYEEGYFDCAFYSVRQSIENMNNMLYVSNNDVDFSKWKAKERFPTDNQIKSQLKEIDNAYSELKAIIPDVFEKYEDLLKKSNKYIHKQGFDTFYIQLLYNESVSAERTTLFEDLLKNAIVLLLIMNIILDPLSLALSDPDVDAYISFDPMTKPIPVGVLKDLMGESVVDRIKTANFYKDFSSYFLSQDKMNDATYNVVRYQYFDVDKLDEIENQKHLLNVYQQLCLCILENQLKISHFYFKDDFRGYSTSILPSHELREYRSDQFDPYTVGEGAENILWKGMYLSVYKVFDTYIILQHNEKLSRSALSIVRKIVGEFNQQYASLMNLTDQ